MSTEIKHFVKILKIIYIISEILDTSNFEMLHKYKFKR